MATHAELIEQGIERRKAILDFISMYHAENGFPPSVAEIAEDQQVAKNSIWHHLQRLQRDGKITMTHGKYRSIRVVDA